MINSSQAYSLQIALVLPESDKTFYENIETIVEQADEIDSIYLQFEGGASTTAFVLDGIFKLSEKFNKLPEVMNVDRIAKFVNYISSKRYPTQVKAAYNILSIAIKLTDNQVKLFYFF
jgi:predicted RND superfamily exporter protein